MTTISTIPDNIPAYSKVRNLFFGKLQSSYASDQQKTTPASSSDINFLADAWKVFMLGLPLTMVPPYPIGIPNASGIYEYCEVLFSGEVMEYCMQQGLLAAAYRYHDLIKKTFRNIQNITITVAHDPEIEGYTKLRFLVTLSDTAEDVLEQESAFKRRVREVIASDLRPFFLLRYRFV